MKAFSYAAPRSISDVTALLTENGSGVRILAGGTDIIAQMRENRQSADLIVDIKHIPELNELSYDTANGLTIGAAVSCLRIWSDPTIAALYPGIIDGVSLIGGVQIQGRATVGGNLANASPAADSIPALIVHEAQAEIAGNDGMRTVAVEKFCTAPGRTVLQAGEFLVRLRIKPPVRGFGASYLRFIPRNEMDIAVVGAGGAVVLDETGTRFRWARVALGAVAPTPLYVAQIGELLAGQEVSDDAVEQAGRMASEAATPISDIRGNVEQRKHLAGVLTRRALHSAIERARQNLGITQ